MARRKLLTPDERQALLGIPDDEESLIRYYMLSAQDRPQAETRRRPHNQLGYAVQICIMRFPGRILGAGETPPAAVIAYVAEQLGIDPGAFASYGHRIWTRFAHSRRLAQYPHVTYFLNGGAEEPYPGEERIMVPSPKVATYDLQPEMSAPELTARAIEAIRSGQQDLIVLNFANPDMVGHTGSLPAAVKAVETVDEALGQIAAAIEEAGGSLLVTADHGNCELMRDPATGSPHTAHTTNPVPVILVSGGSTMLRDGRLADVAPTLLNLMGVARPTEMTGQSLIPAPS